MCYSLNLLIGIFIKTNGLIYKFDVSAGPSIANKEEASYMFFVLAR